mgnify:FL=1
MTKVWAKGETIRLNFPMEIQLLASNPLVREDAGRVAVKRGPVVYCMEEADNGKNLHLTKLCVNGEKTAEAADELGEHFVSVTAVGTSHEAGRCGKTAVVSSVSERGRGKDETEADSILYVEQPR